MDRPFPLTEATFRSLGLDAWRIEEYAHENARAARCDIIVRDSDPVVFLEKFIAGVSAGCTVWLASPEWGDARMRDMASFINDSVVPRGSILIPTGGTTGRLRFAVHTWETLRAAALGFGQFYRQESGHRTLCVLPVYHVSGLMQMVRVATLGGRLYFGNPHDPRKDLPADFSPIGCFLSLVPTQLRRLLDDGAEEWLRAFRVIIVGGAALDATLAVRSLEAGLRLSPSYGMTETAAVACALDPDEFLSGVMGAGRPLPHVRIELGRDARVRIRAASLCKALVPDGGVDLSDGLLTNDIGYMDSAGVLRVRMRADRVIVTGGQKVDPGEVEAALFASGLVRDSFVMGEASEEWGEAVVALYVARGGPALEAELREFIRGKLSPVHVPKKWVRLDTIPRSDAGKPDIAAIHAILEHR